MYMHKDQNINMPSQVTKHDHKVYSEHTLLYYGAQTYEMKVAYCTSDMDYSSVTGRESTRQR